MKVFIVHAHPEKQSFNAGLTQHAKAVLEQTGNEVIISDLYAMNFNPIEDNYATENDGFSEDIKAEMEKLFWCDVLIFQFPLWWFGLPAILKGWVDKVFAAGKIYGGGKWYDNGVFKGKKAMLSLTTGGKLPMYTEVGLHGDIHTILYPINHGILRYVGFDVLPPFVVFGATKINDERRKGYLREYEKRLVSIDETYPIIYPALADFDENFQLKS